MSQSNENSDLLEKLMERGLESGGRIFQGLFSSPWTGVPTALLIMSQLDPSGKLTQQFMTNLGSFLSSITLFVHEALRGIFRETGVGGTGEFPLPGTGTVVVIGPTVPGGIGIIPEAPPPAPGQATVTKFRIVTGPWETQWDATLSWLGLTGIKLLFTIWETGRYRVEKGTDGKFYVTDTTIGA